MAEARRVANRAWLDAAEDSIAEIAVKIASVLVDPTVIGPAA